MTEKKTRKGKAHSVRFVTHKASGISDRIEIEEKKTKPRAKVEEWAEGSSGR